MRQGDVGLVQQLLEVGRRQGPTDEKTLHTVATLRYEPVVLLEGLDTLSDDTEMQAVGQCDDGTADRAVFRVLRDVGNE